jgi:hypothetical protein
MITMERKDIERKAREFVTDLMDNMAEGHPDEITAQWLMEIHPELNAEEAEEYRLFLMRNTFVFRGCYGDGSRWWPRWLSLTAEIKSL